MVDCCFEGEIDCGSEDSVESDCRNRAAYLKIDDFSLFLFSGNSPIEFKTI
jgi:hypothetical protein